MAMVISIPTTFALVCNVAVSILFAAFGLMYLPDQRLLRAAPFWNAHAALPPGSSYKQIALDACASSMSRAIRGTGYDLCVRQDDMDHIDIQVSSYHLRQHRDAVWDHLDICARICPTENSRLYIYKN